MFFKNLIKKCAATVDDNLIILETPEPNIEPFEVSDTLIYMGGSGLTRISVQPQLVFRALKKEKKSL